MALRWYTIVVDCHDVAAQGQWWADVLGWPKVYEADDEVVIIPPHLEENPPADAAAWHRSPPGLVFVKVPEGKTVKNRLHIDLAPHTTDDREEEIARLLLMGATRVDVGQSDDVGWEVFADLEGNEFCVLGARDF